MNWASIAIAFFAISGVMVYAPMGFVEKTKGLRIAAVLFACGFFCMAVFLEGLFK